MKGNGLDATNVRRWRPYPAYRLSRIIWSARIPDHWAVGRLGDYASLLNGFPFESEAFDLNEGTPLVRIRDLLPGRTETFYRGPNEREARIGNDDLLVGMDGDFNVAWWRGGPAVLNQRLCCLRPSARLDKRFLYYSLPFSLKWINDLTYSTTVKHLASPDVRKILFPLPPLEEQCRIAAFLNRETTRIDALIEKKKRLIALLEEKRQAVIGQAVARGLDPTARLHRCSLPWIGPYPSHWSIVAIGWVASVCNGSTPSRSRADYWDEADVPWVSSSEVNEQRVTQPTEFISRTAVKELSLRVIPKGAVLLGMIGQGRTRGMSAILDIDACINQNVAAIQPGSRIDPEYLYYALTQAYEPIRQYGRGGQQDALNCDIIGSLRIPLPPRQEQERIAAYLKEQDRRLDEVAAWLEQHKRLLSEYRTAMISAAVTGQIDVRPEAAP